MLLLLLLLFLFIFDTLFRTVNQTLLQQRAIAAQQQLESSKSSGDLHSHSHGHSQYVPPQTAGERTALMPSLQSSPSYQSS